MIRISIQSSKCSAGVTLVEVIAALAIIATLVIVTLGAHSRLVKQWHRADLCLQGVDVAESLMSEWWENPQKIAHNDRGEVEEPKGWRWVTHSIHDEQLKDNNLEIVQLEVFPPKSSKYANTPALTLDFILDAPPDEEEEANANEEVKDENNDEYANENDKEVKKKLTLFTAIEPLDNVQKNDGATRW